MQCERVDKDQLQLIGISVRTCNADELNPATAKIGALVNRYWQENIATQIPNRKNPGITIIAYTDYASDEHGDYTCFIGEEVSSLESISSGLTSLIIAPNSYQKFTTEQGTIPEIVILSWQKIWQMSEQELGGKRNYQTDFEVYDQRAIDINAAVIDLYVGIH
jgi:predicted transcriptional regulator YdeE